MQLRPTDLLRSGTIGEHRLVYDESTTRPANAKLIEPKPAVVYGPSLVKQISLFL